MNVVIFFIIQEVIFMSKFKPILFSIISLCTFTFSAVLSAAPNSALLFGSVAQDTPAVMYKRLGPLKDYLSQALNRPVELKLSPNMGDAIKKVASNKVDVTYLTPVAYLRAHEQGNSQLIAKMVTNKRSTFQLMIVVRADSPIKTVEQLVGKKFAFGDKKALLQRATVTGAGVSLEKLGSYEFIGHYDNIARGVARGLYDAGILKDTKAFKWEKKGLRILYSSPHLPPYNIAASNKLDKQTIAALRKAFLQLDINNPKHKNVIKALDKKYDGFVETSDAEYDIVRKLIQPFSKPAK